MDASALSQWLPLIACAVAFLVGSIPFGLLVARLFKVQDIRREGSGNVGATNVTRVAGAKAGVLTLALDAMKGALPVVLVQPLGTGFWAAALGVDGFEFPLGAVWTVGLFAVLGHCFSPWLNFKGGKGVATGLGVILPLSPFAALVGVSAFVLAFLARRIGSLASLTGLTAAAMAHLVLAPVGAHLWAGLALLFVIVIRHESNIDALLSDREKSF